MIPAPGFLPQGADPAESSGPRPAAGPPLGRLDVLAYRLYRDFFMPSRLQEYDELLRMLVGSGYESVSIGRFASRTAESNGVPRNRVVLLRHDVDSDIETARAMFDLEHALGIRSSYYFRLQTADLAFMRELEAKGSEVGYHYEEIATVAKRRGILTRDGMRPYMREVRDLFRANLEHLRAATGLPIRTVAAHGDFANRVLQMTNRELLDSALREELSIAAEAYDEALQTRFSLRVSDTLPPVWWKPCDPRPHIRNGARVVHLLLHPSQWRAAPFENASALCRRCTEGVVYWTRSRVHGGWGPTPPRGAE